MQGVATCVSDPGMRPRDLRPSLGAILRAALAAGQLPLIPLKATLVLFPMFRVRYLLACRQGRKMRQADVNAHVLTSRWQRRRTRAIHLESYEPASSRVADNSNRGRVERCDLYIGPRPCELDRTGDLRQPEPAATHAERRPSVVGGLAAMPGLKPRIAGTLGEERRERSVLVPQCLLQRHRGHLVQERQVRIPFHGGQHPAGLGVGETFAFGPPPGLPLGEDPVPHHPDAAERTRQHLLLRLVGVCPAPVGHSHVYRLARTTVISGRRRLMPRPERRVSAVKA
jgi:hypothetical protein